MKIEKDKIFHLECGFIIAAFTSATIALTSRNKISAWLAGFIAAMTAASAKEFGDKTSGSKWDWLDYAFTALGGAIGSIIGTLLI